MCGILGYVGPKEAEPILLEGLRRLEYRGYDSAGMVTMTGHRLHLRKCAGRIADLGRYLQERPAPGCHGISHTRWATHGPASDRNAHPHLSQDGLIAVVHNGVIENYTLLKRQLLAQGVSFQSDTDTEVIAQLIARHHDDDLVDAVRRVLPMLKGTYGLAVISARNPEVIVGARLGSPLVLGLGDYEHYLASDPGALAGSAEKVVYLQDHQLCVLTPDTWHIFDQDRTRVDVTVQSINNLTCGDSDKGLFDHHMLKEIYEQPESLENAMRGRLSDGDASAHFGGLNLDSQQLRRAERLILTGCGTSYHAALVGEYLIEEFARIPVEVEYASEFRYRNPPMDRNTIVLAITQSGETADTLAALRESKRKGHPTLAICNVVGSSIAREADGGVYLHAGPEIGVASTKAFTSQVTVLTMLALYLGRMRHMSSLQGTQMIRDLRALPDVIRRTLHCHDEVRSIAERYAHVNNFLYLGRQYLYPLALEGALKLKEISYIHAEGYAAAEMKHGPIALIDEHTPSLFLVPRGGVSEKVMSNLEEIKARGGPVIAIASEGDEEITSHLLDRADDVVFVPAVADYLQPLVMAVPLQLLAYHVALQRNCDVDKPRNLAKASRSSERRKAIAAPAVRPASVFQGGQSVMKNTVKKFLPRSVKKAIKWLLHMPSNDDCAPVVQRLRKTLNWFGPELDAELGFFNYVEYHLPQYVTPANYVGKDVLDLGCGVGGASAYFALKGARSIWGFDPSYLNNKVLSQVRQLPRCRFIPKALDKNLVGKQRFDLIYARFVTEHIKDCGETFQTVFDLLRPGGRFLATHNNYYGALGGHDQAFIRHVPENHRQVISLAEPCWTKPEKCEASAEFRRQCEGRHDWTVKEWHLTPEDCTKCLYYHRAQLWGHLLHQDTYTRDYPGEFYTTRCLNKITPFQLRQYLIEAGFKIVGWLPDKCENQPPKELLEQFSEADLRTDGLLFAADKPA